MSKKAEQILRAAEKVFGQERRFHKVTLDDVCQEAGIGKGTIYRYFQDKEDLYWNVILAGQETLLHSAQEAAAGTEDPRKALRCVAACMMDFYMQRSNLFGLMWGENLRNSAGRHKVDEGWRKQGASLVAIIADLMHRAIKQKDYVSACPPEELAQMFLAMINASLWHMGNAKQKDHWLGNIMDLAENGLLQRKRKPK